MATLEDIHPHWISLRPRVVLVGPKAIMSSQYLCGTARPDSLHVVHEVQIRDQHGELQWIQAPIDCNTTCIVMSPRLLKRLGLPHKAAHITTHGHYSQVIMHTRERGKTVMMVHYLDHLALVNVPEVLVVPMWVDNLVLGIPSFKTCKPEINRASGRLTSSKTSRCQAEAPRSAMIVQWNKGQDDKGTNVWQPDIGGSTPTINSMSEILVDPDGKPRRRSEDSPTPDIEILGATTLDNLSARDETIKTFALPIGERSGLLGATVEVTNSEDPGEIKTFKQQR